MHPVERKQMDHPARQDRIVAGPIVSALRSKAALLLSAYRKYYRAFLLHTSADVVSLISALLYESIMHPRSFCSAIQSVAAKDSTVLFRCFFSWQRGFSLQCSDKLT